MRKEKNTVVYMQMTWLPQGGIPKNLKPKPKSSIRTKSNRFSRSKTNISKLIIFQCTIKCMEANC